MTLDADVGSFKWMDRFGGRTLSVANVIGFWGLWQPALAKVSIIFLRIHSIFYLTTAFWSYYFDSTTCYFWVPKGFCRPIPQSESPRFAD